MEKIECGKRIDWIDIYKGIAICLMVVGHVTGQFNHIIYQFHMAAFFFVSGYTSKGDKGCLTKFIWDRFYSLVIPYIFTFFLFIFVDSILYNIGLRHLFYTEDMVYIGVCNSFLELFLNGNCYAWLLGAGWFVLVLFTTEIIHCVVLRLCTENTRTYVIIMMLIYIYSYSIIDQSEKWKLSFFSFDLAFVGLGFYGTGYLLNRMDFINKLFSYKYLKIVVMVVNIGAFWYFSEVKHITVNYPTRSFNSPIFDFAAGMNGVIFLMIVAGIAERFWMSRKLLSYLGRNTLGILYYHFWTFKLAYFFLYLLNIVPISYISNFLPTPEISLKWWWLITGISIACSLFVWKILALNRHVNFFLGMQKERSTRLFVDFTTKMKK